MSNITNPLTGTKVDGATFTAAECNTVGSNFARCMVNDGQTDLQATSSINGGGNKGWSVFACTNISLGCSATRSETCATMNVTCSANYALTTSGATGASISAGGSGSVALATTGTGNVTANSVNDVNLTAANNINLNATANVIADAGKLSLTGSGWPTLGSRSTSASGASVPIEVAQDSAYWARNTDAQNFLSQTAKDDTGASRLAFHLFAPAGIVVTGAVVRVQGVATVPTTRAAFNLYVVSAAGVATFLASVSDSVASGSYSGARDVSMTFAGYTMQEGDVLAVNCIGPRGATWAAGYVVFYPRVIMTATKLKLF